MSQGPLTGRAAKAFKVQAYPKFAATVDAQGAPNVVPLLSARMTDSRTIAFVRFMVWKTAKNFEQNKKISFACPGPRGRAYLAKGEFKEWVTQGPLLEEFESEPLYRYNAYAGANVIGVVDVKEVIEYPGAGILVNIAKGALKRIGRKRAPRPKGPDRGPMPWQVVDKYNRIAAVKFIAMVSDKGDPLPFPLQAMEAPDSSTILFRMPGDGHPLGRLKQGQMLAASVLAFEPSAYQVKGPLAGVEGKGSRRTGRMEIKEVYSAAPPVPGRRIFPPEQ